MAFERVFVNGESFNRLPTDGGSLCFGAEAPKPSCSRVTTGQRGKGHDSLPRATVTG